MEGTSSFAQLQLPQARGWRGLGASLLGALEGAAAAIPLSLGCATVVFGRVAPELVAAGVFATMLALACLHLATARSQRPVFFSARIFEATTIAAMLDQVATQLPGWGLPDTAGVRMAFLCAIGGGAGLWVGVLYLLRAERLTPFIPAPVFAGFSNSIAVALVVSQSRSLWQLVQASAALAAASVALVACATAFALRRWAPRRPAAAAGLAAGLLAGLLWSLAGQPPQVVSNAGLAAPLPLLLADFRPLLDPQVRLWPVLLVVVGNAAILGTMVFINTAMSAQALTQIDGQRSRRQADGVVTGAAMLAAGSTGAAPVSGSILVCLAVARTGRVRATTMALLALVVAAVYLTGVLGWVPLAAVAGVLLCEAWFLVDRPSVALLADWLRGRRLAQNAREDLALIGAVTALAVVANMVVAAFGGLVLGLFLFAVRSAQQPVRHVWSGRQVASNCARGSAELRLLAAHGEAIRVFELGGDMFFAVGSSLQQRLHADSTGARCVVLDWSRVRHIDSSVAGTVATFERLAGEHGIALFHGGACSQDGNVADELARRIPGARLAPDLDYALELAENRLIQLYAQESPGDASSLFGAMHLFDGLTIGEILQLEEAMTHRLFRAGETILAAGAVSDELMLILHGSASVVVPGADGRAVRLAGVRRGAIIGEVGFLDGSPRSASVVAHDDVMVASLTREAYEHLCRSMPGLVPKLLANMAVALASRLRHASQLALARSRAS